MARIYTATRPRSLGLTASLLTAPGFLRMAAPHNVLVDPENVSFTLLIRYCSHLWKQGGRYVIANKVNTVSAPANQGWFLAQESTGQLFFFACDGVNPNRTATTVQYVPPARWIPIMAWRDTAAVQQVGVKFSSHPETLSLAGALGSLSQPTRPFEVGTSAFGQAPAASMSDCMWIKGRKISNDEYVEWAREGTAPADATCRWSISEGVGPTCYDSINGQNGTITGALWEPNHP